MKHRLIATRASEGAVAFPISVHARARRATDEDVVNCLTGRVSIHARARRATVRTAASETTCFRFNPRARTARDGPGTGDRSGGICFNPRARTARDAVDANFIDRTILFQSTRAHGARLSIPFDLNAARL